MATLYLIPAPLSEDGIAAIPAAVTEAIKNCAVFFAENERTTRRYFKKLWKYYLPDQAMVIDNYEWYTTGDQSADIFRIKVIEGKNIGLISEAGCPGIADPGQQLVALAHELHLPVKPVTGPSSILLALMASGMNGQHFCFNGYLPVDSRQRAAAISRLESESEKRNCTQVFIETPYRNNQMLESLLKLCRPDTRLCIAANISGGKEFIRTMNISGWKKEKLHLHKQPVIFCLHRGIGAQS